MSDELELDDLLVGEVVELGDSFWQVLNDELLALDAESVDELVRELRGL